MNHCWACDSVMRPSMEEIEPGVAVDAWRCPKCAEVELTLEQYGRYFRAAEVLERKAFKVGGSLALRIPKQLADAAGIKEDTQVVFRRAGQRLIIEAARKGKR